MGPETKINATMPAHGFKLNLILLTNDEGAPVRQRKRSVTYLQLRLPVRLRSDTPTDLQTA